MTNSYVDVDVQTNDSKHIVIRTLTNDLQVVNIKFLHQVKYIPSIDKYCVEDIIKPYNKQRTAWSRKYSVMSFMKKYPSLFDIKHSNLYIDYSVIPLLLNWIDDSLSYEFQNDLDKTKKDNDGYIYLVQYPSDIKEHVVKVGRTLSIKQRYGNKVDVIGLEYVDDMFRSEDRLIETFEKKFGSPVRGREFFRCDKIEEAIELYYDVVYDLFEEQELDDTLKKEDKQEDDDSVDAFMNKHFPAVKRVLLKDICDKYKEVTGVRITLMQMREELEPLGFKITNVSRKYYATRK